MRPLSLKFPSNVVPTDVSHEANPAETASLGVPADASHEAIPNETAPTEVIAEGDNEAANPSQV